ncbi:DUF92 domain-containing protein [Priestia megaterium]|nr:DUF92 domain-containing protein [Priestia megaterium]
MFIIIMAFAGYCVKALSFSGAFMAIIVGISVYNGFSFAGLVLLAVFFGTSTFFSKYKKHQKRDLEEKIQKHGQRDYVQVIANGGVAFLCSWLFVLTDESLFVIMFMISIAAANADTWASEVGSLSKKRPLYILTFKEVEAGTSGAVSLLGTAAGFSGALLIAVTSLYVFPGLSVVDGVVITLFGFLGNVIDTILGATVQVGYTCSVCGLKTEREVHCKKKTNRYKGVTLCNNDVVNFLAIIIAAIIGGLLVSV